ncbi:Oidioi.mRNA.OKI2018_I69.PAR.g8655.t1.cds [Oikopleura dioica]|uniref:Oidioi.mRNA.OKI2018_I69.PAR.g8655.t1.cds n=1 Tax=Oikopleura dioica TaxID=34765 RepID=A0ABN7RKJ6_OIKDI|nr:Oidioi.mRNA.OKI2018_I69.PAR.g8655.t1.cds [Oikopleura dioica]
MKRFETFESKSIRDEETASDAVLIYAKEKPVDNVDGKRFAIVTITGTKELQEMFQNLRLCQVKFEETEAFAHNGFYECFEALKPKIESFLDATLKEKQVDEILICGHSLGGAVACLIGASLAPKYEATSFLVVTVASPKIGNRALQDLFKQRVKKHLRIRLGGDPVVNSMGFMYWFKHSGEDGEETDYPTLDASEFAYGSHSDHDYLMGIERNKEVILKRKFGNAVEKAKKIIKNAQ